MPDAEDRAIEEEASRHEWSSLLDQARDAIVLLAPDGRILAHNAAAAELLGLAGRLNDHISRLVPAWPTRPPKGPVEVEVHRPDGARVRVELSLSPVTLQGETSILAIARDTTQRALAQTRDEQERKRLKDANESLESFAYVISHDLKEPVRAMSLYILEARDETDAALKAEYLTRAAQANASLQRLLEGLLEWSRAAMEPLEPEPLDIKEVLDDPGCRAQFANLLTERNATLDVAEGIPAVHASRGLLCRVLGNLITNAVKHNPSKKPVVRIHAAPGPAALRVTLFVDDNGPGFPEALQDRVASLKNRPTTIKGGFGLAITRRALERLGGTIALEAAPGGGGRARVTLPAPPRAMTLEERVRELV